MVDLKRQGIIFIFAVLAALYWTNKSGLFSKLSDTNENWNLAKKYIVRRLEVGKYDAIEGKDLGGRSRLLIITRTISEINGGEIVGELTLQATAKTSSKRPTKGGNVLKAKLVVFKKELEHLLDPSQMTLAERNAFEEAK